MSTLNNLFDNTGAPTLTKDQSPGEVREGIITSWDLVQATKFQSTELDFDKNGNPKMQLRIDLSTNYQTDAEDNGDRCLYIKTWYSGQQQAFAEAIKATGLDTDGAVTVGTFVQVTFKGKKTVKTKTGSQFEENDYEFTLTPPAGAPTTPAPASSPVPAQQAAPASAPAAPTATEGAPADPAEMIAAGWTDQQIIDAVPGLSADVVSWLRGQAA